ncbi:MAG: ATP-binding protein [Eubacteriales bacterium]|nr:ATP-binding protein [Eubacteriales bacterium]
MNLCVLSGKGGTGKTTVSVNLSLLLGYNYIDCDVEEPNGFIFLKPENVMGEDVRIDYPVIDKAKCTLCRKCAEACLFNALVTTKSSVMVFEKLCHACGACAVVCGADAVSYAQRKVGRIEQGISRGIAVKRGVQDVGEYMGVPVIRQLLSRLPEGNNILDCPPGTSCNVVNTIAFADRALIVTEPTAFGLHDMELAVRLLRSRNIPFGVVVNKHSADNTLIQDYCKENRIRLIGTVSYSKEAAVAYSTGRMLTELPLYKKEFEAIALKIGEVR